MNKKTTEKSGIKTLDKIAENNRKEKLLSVGMYNGVGTSIAKHIQNLKEGLEQDINKILLTEEQYNIIFSTAKETPQHTLKYIHTLILHYMDMEEIDAKLCSIWVLGTYVFQLFNQYPYLYFNAPKGSGKSKLLRCIIWASYNGVITGNTTIAAIFHTINNLNSTLGIDESELLSDKNRSMEINNILLNGFEKGSPVLRVPKSKTGFNELESYEVYSPKVIANIKGLSNDALQSRVIPIRLIKTNNPKKGNVYPEKMHKDFSHAVLQGLKLAYENHPEIIMEYRKLSADNPGFVGRSFNLFVPLLSICRIYKPEWYNDLLNHFKKLDKEINTNTLIETSETQLIESLNDMLGGQGTLTDEDGEWIQATRILEQFIEDHFSGEVQRWTSSRWLSNLLNRIGFTQKERLGKGNYYFIERTRLNKLSKAYLPKEEHEETS